MFISLSQAEQLSQAEEMDKEDNRPDEVHSYLDVSLQRVLR